MSQTETRFCFFNQFMHMTKVRQRYLRLQPVDNQFKFILLKEGSFSKQKRLRVSVSVNKRRSTAPAIFKIFEPILKFHYNPGKCLQLLNTVCSI